MSRIDDYLNKQRQVISDAERNYQIGTRIRENLGNLYLFSDDELRVFSSDGRTNQTNSVEGTEALDPVYRKISKAVVFVRKYDSEGISGIIADRVIDLQIKIENRQMGREEYMSLQNTSTKDLVAEWSNEILSRLGKVA